MEAPSQGTATSYVIGSRQQHRRNLEAGSAPGLANVAQIDLGPGTGLGAVAPPGTYFVRVRARSGCGLGPASNEVTLTIN